ncbi:hypothetical protein FA13DRAFT_1725606 [Coprinellus micaceus]|uniref:F-box domain-containing protein n=1 Tax=Coprinellus micaceus TaxID=71717 RepID=A0A4Y7TWI1_COPMI|nr:hypothetical protein FA13DRAFT_1725606 [Coprinellus micaceus]
MAERPDAEAKRQKVSQRPQGDSVTQTRPDGREGKETCSLVTMPMEILLEILGLVSPGDLLNMSRTNKLFGTTPNVKSVWVASRSTVEAPEPPDDFTEVRWAKLLFHTNCQGCGRSDAYSLNLMLRRRVCGNCKKNCVVKMNSKWSKNQTYHNDGEIVGIVPFILCSDSGGWSDDVCGFPNASQYYWRTDVYPAMVKSRELKDAISDGTPAQRTPSGHGKRSARKWVEESRKLSKEHQAWYSCLDEQYKSRAGAVRAQRLAAFKSKFILLGYSTVDINAALSIDTDGIKEGSALIKEKAWDKLRPKFEQMIIARREWRLEKELQSIVVPRIQIFKALYKRSLSQLRPYDKRQVPAWQFLRTLPGVAEYIDAHESAAVTRRSFQPFIDKLLGHVADYWDQYKETITSRIPTTEFDEGSSPVDMARFVFICDAKHTETHEEGRELQTTVVSCDSGLLSGWAMIAEHLQRCEGRHCYEKGAIPEGTHRHTIKPRQYYCEVAASLIALSDVFFVCTACSLRRRYDVYTWRQALYHSRKAHAQSDVAPAARAHDERMEAQELMLHCNYCPSFSIAGRCNVLNHLQDQHGISTPESVDYFVDENSRRSLLPYRYDSPRPGESLYHCSHCPTDLPILLRRRFTIQGVSHHLSVKHRIGKQGLDLDFKLADAL